MSRLRTTISSCLSAAITARYAWAALTATWSRVSWAAALAVPTRSAAWFLAAQPAALSTEYDAVALNAVWVFG